MDISPSLREAQALLAQSPPPADLMDQLDKLFLASPESETAAWADVFEAAYALLSPETPT